MDKNKDVYLHRQRGHESAKAVGLDRGLGASRLPTDHLVDAIAAG
jgi:hypothetical protein